MSDIQPGDLVGTMDAAGVLIEQQANTIAQLEIRLETANDLIGRLKETCLSQSRELGCPLGEREQWL